MRPARTEVFELDDQPKEAGEQVRLIAEGGTDVLIRTPGGVEITAPEVISQVVQMVAAGLAEGRAMVVTESDATVSPTEAARMLAVSRPMVTRWIADGLLADSPVGAHHKIPVESVLALRTARQQAGYRAMSLLEAAEKEPEIASRVESARDRARKRMASRPAR